MKFSRVWLFDLDNTLHNASHRIFPHINRAMTAYMQTHLGLDTDAANEMRQRYWQRYGATLGGLVRHHDTDPQHFLHATHDSREIAALVTRPPGLRTLLKRLPGRKLIFSNAPTHYAKAVLKVLGIADLFSDVFAIEHCHYHPKPDSHGFLRLLRANKLHASDCIMIEDTLANLRTAKKLGMSTVWIGRAIRVPGYVDFSISNLMQLSRLAAHLNPRTA